MKKKIYTEIYLTLYHQYVLEACPVHGPQSPETLRAVQDTCIKRAYDIATQAENGYKILAAGGTLALAESDLALAAMSHSHSHVDDDYDYDYVDEDELEEPEDPETEPHLN